MFVKIFLSIYLLGIGLANCGTLRQGVYVEELKSNPKLVQENTFNVKVSGPNKNILLNLKHADPILSPDFQFTIINEDGSAEKSIFSKENFDRLLIDEENQAVVKIGKDDNGIRMFGIIDEMRIDFDEETGEHFVTKDFQLQQPQNVVDDYVDPHLNLTWGGESIFPEGQNPSKTLNSAQVELAIVIDMKNFMTEFGGSVAKTTEYLAIMMQAVNNRYSTIANLQIRFSILEIIGITSVAQQPFIEKNRVPGGLVDMRKTLSEFAAWVPLNAKSKFDLAMLISGEDFALPDGATAVYRANYAGLAYLSVPCSTRVGYSVNEDHGGYWKGIFTIAHELAHNLGSAHDGEAGAATCPWSDGYLMSYEGWGTRNKLYFSSCTIAQMEKVVSSDQANCLKVPSGSTTLAPTNVNIGDKMSLDEQCKKATGKDIAYSKPGQSLAEICLNLVCQWKEGTTTWTSTRNFPAADNSPCGPNGEVSFNLANQVDSRKSKELYILSIGDVEGTRCINGECKIVSGTPTITTSRPITTTSMPITTTTRPSTTTRMTTTIAPIPQYNAALHITTKDGKVNFKTSSDYAKFSDYTNMTLCYNGTLISYAGENFIANSCRVFSGLNKCMTHDAIIKSFRFIGAKDDVRRRSAIFFDGVAYTGKMQTYFQNTANMNMLMRSVSLIDGITSIDSLTVYTQSNYTGDSMCVKASRFHSSNLNYHSHANLRWYVKNVEAPVRSFKFGC